VLDQWYDAHEKAVPTSRRLNKEEFAVATACLAGWAAGPIIFGEGSRDEAGGAVAAICHLTMRELNNVFEAMDSVTTMP
jgi:hypothetical protein